MEGSEQQVPPQPCSNSTGASEWATRNIKRCPQNNMSGTADMECDKKSPAFIKDSQRESGPQSMRPVRKPWITGEFMEMIIQRDELHARLKMNPDNVMLRKEYSTFRNRTSAMRRKLRFAYQMYLEEL
jgi:hypothetical protein